MDNKAYVNNNFSYVEKKANIRTFLCGLNEDYVILQQIFLFLSSTPGVLTYACTAYVSNTIVKYNWNLNTRQKYKVK